MRLARFFRNLWIVRGMLYDAIERSWLWSGPRTHGCLTCKRMWPFDPGCHTCHAGEPFPYCDGDIVLLQDMALSDRLSFSDFGRPE